MRSWMRLDTRSTCVLALDGGLHVDRSPDGGWHGGELQQQPITQALHHPATMRRQHLGAHQIDKAPPAIDDAGLVRLHQSNRLDDIHHHDGAARTLQLRPCRVIVDGLGHADRVLA